MYEATTSRKEFTLHRPQNNISTFKFHSSHRTTIHLPAHSTWTPSPHWHETHTEHIRVLQGTIILLLNGVACIVTADDGVQTVNPFVIHEWMRADHAVRLGLIPTTTTTTTNDNEEEVEVIVEEYTTPSDGAKEVFFRNLFSFLSLSTPRHAFYTTLQIGAICAAFDNWEVVSSVLSRPGVYSPAYLWWNWALTHLVYGFIGVVAWLVGIPAAREEFTPRELWAVAGLKVGSGGEKID